MTLLCHNLLTKYEVGLGVCKKAKAHVSEQSRSLWMLIGKVGFELLAEILAVISGFFSCATWLRPES